MSFYKRGKGKDVMFLAVVLVQPKSVGSILLKSSDPMKHPLIYTDPFTDERDLETQIKANQDFASIINTTFFKNLGAEFLELETCADFGVGSKKTVTPTYHQMGTCAMGSVVDSRLRVYGVKNLRVVDTSVMPTIPSGNTYAPVIMVAEKAADMIKEGNV